MVNRDLVVEVRAVDMPEVKALLERLCRVVERYGRHDRTCAVVVHGGNCDCGFEACLHELWDERMSVESFNKAVEQISHDHGGILRCETCHKTGAVLPAYWRIGWPKCCGYTMRWWTARQIKAGEMR